MPNIGCGEGRGIAERRDPILDGGEVGEW